MTHLLSKMLEHFWRFLRRRNTDALTGSPVVPLKQATLESKLKSLAFHLHGRFNYILGVGLFLQTVPYSPQLQRHANNGIHARNVPLRWSHLWGMFSIDFLNVQRSRGQTRTTRCPSRWGDTTWQAFSCIILYWQWEIFLFYDKGNGRRSFSPPKVAERKPRGCRPKELKQMARETATNRDVIK